MIPEVNKLLSLDVYRDGGSLSASFSDNSGTQHELMFLIKNTRNDRENIKKYRCAIIESFIKSEYISPVTGLKSEKIDKKEKGISWDDAISLLNKIKPHISNFKSDYLWVFSSMSTIANNEKHEIKYS